MENPKTPETLEAKKPDEKTPKEASGSSGVAENCSGLAPVSVISIEEIGTKTNVCEVGKGILVNNDCSERVKEEKMEFNMSLNDEENEAESGLVQSQSDGDLVGLGSNGNGGVAVKVLVQDEDKELESNGVDPSRKIEVPTGGISLFVQISGSRSSLKEDGDEERGKELDNRECEFSVGDIVWVQTKNQTWWPGKIHNPADAPRYATRSGPGDHLLVGYYGISHFAWFCPSQLRPFHENFKQMLGKNGARIFLGAVEKALDEFGRRVNLEMTCSCASGHDQLLAGRASVAGRLGEFSVASFKPELLLERLKYAAEVVSMPHMLDFTVTRNCLSAFYRSIGHRQLPVHLLAERNDTEGDKTNTAIEGSVLSEPKKRKMKRDSVPGIKDDSDKVENIACEEEGVMDKGFNLRERKKSRYLSYPYTNWGQKAAAETEDPNDLKVTPEASVVAGQSNMVPSNSKRSGEKFWRKWYGRLTGGSQIPTGLELTNAASAELLCELRSVAVDCLHPKGNNFIPVCWFLSRYRVSLFREESVENEANGEEENSQALFDKPKRKRTKKKENQLQGEDTVRSPDVIGSTTTGVQDANESLDPCLGHDSVIIKNNDQPNSVRSKTKPLYQLSDVSISIAANGLLVRESNKAKQRKKKKGEEANGDNSQTKQTTNIPDLNGSGAASSLLVDEPKVMNHVSLEVKTKPPKETLKGAGSEDSNANAAGLLDFHGNNAKPGTIFVDLRVPNDASACMNNSYTAGLQFAKDRLTIGLQLGEGKPGLRKRKRKEKAAAMNNIPDLNGASAESNALGKEVQETNNGLTPPVKPKQKRGRRKGQFAALNYPRNVSISWRPDMNLSYNRMETNGATIGTALLLTFATGVPMPSRDDLLSTFCKFGPLRESETRLLKDPGSAQIVFTRIADAAEALKSIERNKLFGATLVNYRLHHLPAASRAPETNRTLCATPSSSTQTPAAPPLDVIKQKLQMMTSMLEKSGDNLSPEVRAKLESEIKGLLSKVSSMTGSCS